MRGTKGLQIACAKCNTELFLKLIGTNETNGGYTRWDEFEEVPEDWLYETAFGYLCPKCATQFKRLMTEFLGDNTPSGWKLKNSVLELSNLD